MPGSTWLSDDQLCTLLDAYYAGPNSTDEWSRRLERLIDKIPEEILSIQKLESLSDSELVEQTVAIYRNIVRVPMYYKAITSRPKEVRNALLYLLESDDDIIAKVNTVRKSDGEHYIKGLGKSFWSLFFIALDSRNNPYWNQKTEDALKELGLAHWANHDTPGEVYAAVAEAERYLVKLYPQADLIDIDHFMHFVVELEGKDLLQNWRGGALASQRPTESDANEIDKIIGAIREIHLPPSRIEARQEAEAAARELFDDNVGKFDEPTLRQFFEFVNTDYFNGQPRHNRFSPAFIGATANAIIDQLEQFNDWTDLLWQAKPQDLEELLDLFWEEKPIAFAGTSLPTLILYLRDPQKYSIWLDPMVKGFNRLTGASISRETGTNYLRYCQAVKKLREQHNLHPQEMDVILVLAGRDAAAVLIEETELAVVPNNFTGFVTDTFTFLADLQENNDKEWLDKNRERYRSHVREPLRALFQDVAPVIAALNPNFETEAKYGKVLATIGKRWATEDAPYNTYLWGAFYRVDYKKQTDAQLFIIIHPTRISVGLGVGNKAQQIIDQFHKNLEANSEGFYRLLKPLIENDFRVTVAETHGAEKQEILELDTEKMDLLQKYDRIDIERAFSPSDPIVYKAEFATEVGEVFEALYPLYRFFVSDTIANELPELLPPSDEEEPVSIEIEEDRYSFVELESETYLDAEYLVRIETLLRDKGQVILYGPPGTGKTYVAKKFARYFVDQTGGELELVQFHPSYSYEEFIEGIRPETSGQAITYSVKPGIFLQFCERARKNRTARYVMIIDEVNRGSLPRIFGELLYLLEYRGSEDRVRLPYSNDRFGIPPNVYIVGTMNTADRSIALVDHALRRRFYFIETKPNPELLRSWLEANGKETLTWTADLLELVNKQLQQHQISWHLHVGHSHFMIKDPKKLSEDRVSLIWQHAIMPMLAEYFYNRLDLLTHYDYGLLKSSVNVMG